MNLPPITNNTRYEEWNAGLFGCDAYHGDVGTVNVPKFGILQITSTVRKAGAAVEFIINNQRLGIINSAPGEQTLTRVSYIMLAAGKYPLQLFMDADNGSPSILLKQTHDFVLIYPDF